MYLKHLYLAPDDGAGQGAPGAADQTTETKPEKTFSQDEVDKIVGDRLAKERKKFEKDVADRIAAAKTEAERLAAMTADEKAAHEKQEQERKRKEHEDALNKREAAIQLRELRAEALETLANEGFPKALADCLDYSSAEKCQASIKSIGAVFNSAVQAEVERRLQGHTPSNNGGKGEAPSRGAQLTADYLKRKYGKE